MLNISKNTLSEIIGHAREGFPREACGVLSGKNGKVEKVHPMKNVSETPELCYQTDPREQLSVFKNIRNSGEEVLAIYHSHAKSAAYPSAKDVELAFYPEAVYIIVSLQNPGVPEIKAFRIKNGKINSEGINVR